MSHVLWREIQSTLRRNDGVVYRLLLVQVVIFFLLNLLRLPAFFANRPLDTSLILQPVALPADLGLILKKPWTPVTYAFTHLGLLHLIFNLLVLFWFGKVFCEFAGGRRLFPLYLIGALCGALVFVAAYNLLPALTPHLAHARLVGASAAVMAVMVATAMLVPDYTLFLLLIGPVRIKWIAIALLALSVLAIPGANSGGALAHIGGALGGFMYIRLLQAGIDLSVSWQRLERFIQSMRSMRRADRRKRIAVGKPVGKSSHPEQSPPLSRQERIDRLLDKISASGYDSLTREEKEFLHRISTDE